MIYNNDKLIAAAFIKARAEIGGTVTKDAKGNFGRYATLAAITDATSAALAKHGLAIIQEAILEAEGVTVDTHLLHESGAVIEFGSLTMPLANRTPQTIGSAITYARKYQWAAVCGLAADDADDDGQAAQDASKPTAQNASRTAQRAATPTGSQKAQNGVSRKVDQDTGEIKDAVDGDILFEQAKPKRAVLSDDQQETLMALGKTYYGELWGKEQVRLAKNVSKGAVSRVADLVPEEAQKLIAGLQKIIAHAEAQIAQTESEKVAA